MADLTQAASILDRYLTNRARLHGALDELAEDGIRAADYTPSMARVFDPDKPPPDPPPRPDPTGETAIHDDRARRLRSELDQAETRLLMAIRTLQRAPHPAPRLDQIPAVVKALAQVRRNDPTFRRARTQIDGAAQTFWRISVEVLDARTPKPSDLAHLAQDGEAGCECCARLVLNGVPWWNEPTYRQGQPTDLGGLLAERILLCWTCYRFAVEQEPTRLPTVKELAHRHADPRGRWPKRHAKAA